MARKYSKAAQKEVQKEMRRYKRERLTVVLKEKVKAETSDSYRLVEGS